MLPIDRYLANKSLEISAANRGLKIVYLDVNYWIRLRNQSTGSPGEDRAMLDKALSLAAERKCIFPVSDIVYYEILKQQDERSRRDTFNIVSQLSGNIALMDDHKRIKIEFLHWMAAGQNAVTHTADQLVWSKLPLVIAYPGLAAVDYSTGTNEIQDAFFDFMGEIPMVDISAVENLHQYPFTFKDNVDEMNANKKAYAHQNKTAVQLFLSELGGVLDGADEILKAAMREKYFKDTGREASIEEINTTGTMEWRSLIYHCFKQNKVGSHLPFFRICAALYASFRWNKERQYKDGNDTLDVMHACAALPYCDYFFTERELHTIIEQQKLDQLYNCTVASKTDVVMQLLDSL
ncbi:hypothetical protein KXD93_04660 [Mucilaginibacter sp. BJC16-A38]|uniref:hypothetical protein n=1 Tax=Mucilaginibacter phenanthrenivorans TaxID=1234842 RepID=UPI0021577960|nr:hypothetical protein [Mucilaginibacter phenanthrenivorans]MCR8556917.1 hypothetical protein [Mucilaginibacter phenanthrenivorans]